MNDSRRSRAESKRGNDDLLARFHAESLERELYRRRPVRDGDSVVRPDVVRPLLFELLHVRPLQKTPGVYDVAHVFAFLVSDYRLCDAYVPVRSHGHGRVHVSKKPPMGMKETLTQPPDSREAMVSVQKEVAREAVFEDSFGSAEDGNLLVGVDQAFAQDGDVAVSASVVVRTDDCETVETETARRETRVPYIPGLLAFREGEAVVTSLEGLETTPETVLVDGSGRIHPRQAGLATHVGVALDIPTVGVAKSLLCGTPRESSERLEEGERVPILADGDVDAEDGTTIGYAVQTKQYSDDAATTVNPLYVSPGHRVSAETAADLVAEACDGYKLPEPVRRADKLADEES